MKLGLLLTAVILLGGCSRFQPGVVPGAPRSATYADIDGVNVRYLELSEKEGAPWVVLIDGFASSLETWNAIAPRLAKTHRVLALDLKGFGWTSRPEGDYSPEAEARLVLKLMDKRGVEQAAVVAHSWGSSVALQMALLAKDRVTRLALYDAWVYEEQLPTFFVWARAGGIGEALVDLFYGERADERMALAFYDKERYVTEPFVEQVEAALERPGTRAAALAAIRGQHYEEAAKRYRTIKQQTLLLWGREDQVTRLTFGERLERDLPNAHLVVYAQCGHFPMIEAAGPSTDELERFLAPPPPATQESPR